MKKIGQKLSFLTKIMLVVGLLISNLSSLSVVFAYEGTEDVVVTLNEDVLEISYTEELAEEVEAVDVRVYENYTYSGGLSEEEVVTNYSLTAEQLLAATEGTLELTHNSIFASEEDVVNNFELFDGTYSAKVEIVDVTVYPEETVENTEDVVALEETTEVELTETVIASGTYEEEMLHGSGLSIKLYNLTNDVEITLEDGKYPVSAEYSKVEVVAQILSGGLNPTDVFEYDGEEYMAAELVAKEFVTEIDFSGRLFGEYEVPVEVKVSKVLPITETVSETAEMTAIATTNDNYEEVVYTDSVSVIYESYELNAALLNMVAVSEGYGDAYSFYSEDKDGLLYVLLGTEEDEESVVTKTMLDLYNMLNVAVAAEDENVESTITYTLLKNGINVLEAYDASTGVALEDYLATIILDETVEIVISNEGLSISYEVVIAGDLNSDNILTEEDILELINQVIGESDITDIEKSDLYGFDGKVTSLDAIYLNQVVKTKLWDLVLNDVDATLDATLDVKLNDEILSEENYIISGDEFTVDYVLSLTDYEVNGIAGVFNYDETLFELVSVEVNYDWLGNDENGKFLYLGEESLTGPVEEEETVETETTESENTGIISEEIMGDSDEVTPVDYVVLTATFKALSTTNEESNNIISLEEIELFNSTIESVTNYVLDQNTISTEAIKVTASDDNSLSYLEVAGIEIALEEGVYKYEITVSNDITAVDLKYILGNVAASVTSMVYPEELAEGSNTIVLTITSESGVSQDYTITVVREEAEKTTTQVNYNNYYNDYEDDNTSSEVVVTPSEEEEEVVVEEEESNLSRIIIIILILIVIAGLVYLIFRDEDDDETKKANKAVNKLKKETLEPEVKVTNKTTEKSVSKPKTKSSSNSKNTSSKKDTKSKNKER